MDLRVISIGALSAHPLWGERSPVRSGHATTTLIRAGKKTILVDPGLPDQVLIARLGERANVKPTQVTHIFLTSFNPELRRGLLAFQHATWWISSTERDQIGAGLVARVHEASEEGDDTLQATLQQEIAILHRCQPAPDHLADEKGERIDLFPLPGVTPGLTGLLLAGSRHTTLICGDAVPTVEHLEQGQVLQDAADVDRARESFAEAIEIADLLVLGRDNVVVNPTKRPF
jgi:glyoxylase-like metal-dependent hydrolase (beta-lactamase superfamily II)